MRLVHIVRHTGDTGSTRLLSPPESAVSPSGERCFLFLSKLATLSARNRSLFY